MPREESTEDLHPDGAINGEQGGGFSISLEEWVRRELDKLPPFSEEQDRELRQILGLSEITFEE